MAGFAGPREAVTAVDRVLMQSLEVTFRYPVWFTAGALDVRNDRLVCTIASRESGPRHQIAAVIDSGVASSWPGIEDDVRAYCSAHSRTLALAGDPLVVSGGEGAKNDPALVRSLEAWMHELRLDRHSCLLVIGGGAVQDVAGFAAAVVHRGVRVVRLPTTVLSQADSGVGVKNGVNAFGKKNFLGTFAPPFGVLCDRRFLETLEPRDRVSGMAEAVKVALLRDAPFFRWITEHAAALAAGEPVELWELVERSASLHLDHIATSGDAFELGSARPLDFGHWSAHKLESLTGNRLRHGEAVAIGIALDTIHSRRAGLLDADTCGAVLSALERMGLRPWDDALLLESGDGTRRVLEGLAEFREHLGGDLSLTMLRGIGRAVQVPAIRHDLVLECIDELRLRDRARSA